MTKTIKRDGPDVISAYDLRAIALAVELKKTHGAETTVVTMGPPQARSALVDALAMGMDHAVHLEDRAFAGADTLATARALALWLARGKFDLIMLGKYSLDAETGQVGPGDRRADRRRANHRRAKAGDRRPHASRRA